MHTNDTPTPARPALAPDERRELAYELDRSLASLPYRQRLAIGGKLIALIEGLYTGATSVAVVEQLIRAIQAPAPTAHPDTSDSLPAAA